jgi:hypothetical protein
MGDDTEHDLSRSPVDGITQEYALADHPPNSRAAFRENRPHSPAGNPLN